MLSPLLRFVKHGMPQLLDRCIRRKRHQLGTHDFAHKQDLERIDGIFAGNVKSTARHLLRENGTLQQQHGGRVRQHRSHQQRQKHVDVMRQFKRKKNGCERGVHGSDGGPPHPVEGQPLKGVLRCVYAERQERGEDACQQASYNAFQFCPMRQCEPAQGRAADRSQPDQDFTLVFDARNSRDRARTI